MMKKRQISRKTIWTAALTAGIAVVILMTVTPVYAAGRVTVRSSAARSSAAGSASRTAGTANGSRYSSVNKRRSTSVSNTTASRKKINNPNGYDMDQYSDYDDLYDDNPDDFDGIDEAEDYFDEYEESLEK